ncbi:MAG: hypothetical protein QXF35_02315 [Candidatus Bilamarchaeaceae archaeon]
MKKMLLFLILFFSIVRAQTFMRSAYADWMTLSIIISGIAIVAAAGLIVLSRIFSLKNLEQIAKTEFVYAMSTIAIVIVVGFLIAIGEPLLDDVILKTSYLATFGCFSPTAQISAPISAPSDYIDLYLSPTKNCAIRTLDALYVLSIPVDAAASWYSEIFMSELATGFGIKPIAERIKNVTSILSFYLYAYYVLMYIIKFIKVFAGFFFTVGVALRALPPTRGAGAYFMAAAIGFYFVFPAAYVMFSSISLPSTWETTSLTAHNYQNPLQATCTPEQINLHYEQLCSVPDFSEIKEGCGWGGFSSVTKSITFLKAYKDAIQNFLGLGGKGILILLQTMVNAVCIAPLIAMIITMTFVLNSTNLLGGNIPEVGRGLVKLI